MSRSAALFVFLLQMLVTESAHVLEAHRLVQFDKNGQMFGSRRTVVNHEATLARDTRTASQREAQLQNKDEAAEAAKRRKFEEDDEDVTDLDAKPESMPESKGSSSERDLAKMMAVVKIGEMSPELLADMVDRRGAAGVVILLEKDLSHVSPDTLDQWKQLERYMISRAFDIPIYFSVGNEETNDLVQALNTQSVKDDSVQIVVNGPEASMLPTVPVHNFQGWHHSSRSQNADTESLPTIAIVANYDTFGAAPGLSFGSDHNGSGAVALLELARIFSRLYSEFRTHGSYNILFVLTGGGRMNFAGAKHWLKTVDSRLLESLEFALCLEAIGLAQEKLYLHVSKNPKTTEIRNLYNNFADTAKFMDIPFEVSQWKINISSPFINWQHEQFSRKRILAGTLSGRAKPSPVFTSASIFDTSNLASQKILERNIKFIAEAIAKQVYEFAGKQLEVIKGSLGVNSVFVGRWMKYLGEQPRQAQYTAQNTVLMDNIEKLLNTYCADAKKSTYTLDAGFKFYSETTTDMYIYRVKPNNFNLVLFLLICAYLLFLHLYLKWPTNFAELKTALTLNLNKKKLQR